MFDMALALQSSGVPFDIARTQLDGDLLDDVRQARLSVLGAVDLWDIPFSVIDIETTGSVAGRDGITEIGLVKVNSGRVTGTWSTFINPAQPIPPFITQLTGITNAMVANAPTIGENYAAMGALRSRT